MRRRLASLGLPHHPGLAYASWAPIGDDGKIPDVKRQGWLEDVAKLGVPGDYTAFFAHWEDSLRQVPKAVFELESRLFLGGGEASATEVGLTFHHTWGVPVIPGSALKGLLQHYVDMVYGPDDAEMDPMSEAHPEPDRKAFRGVTYDAQGRIEFGPGEMNRRMFGAPDAPSDAAHGDRAGACRGELIFHDALMRSECTNPLSTDVLTVHQRGYYEGRTFPNDHDDPNPVAFLTVRPKTKFLIAISSRTNDTGLAEHALELLADALQEWGVGGKTSAGYGRLRMQSGRIAFDVESPVKEQIQADLDASRASGSIPDGDLEAAKVFVQELLDRHVEGLRGLGGEALRQSMQLVNSLIANEMGLSKKKKKPVKEIVAAFEAGLSD